MNDFESPTRPQPEVWVFYAHGPPVPEVARFRAEAGELCAAAKWKLQVRKSQNLFGRAVVDGADAENLYRRMHRAPVAVLSIQLRRAAGPFVFTRPPPQTPGLPIHWRHALSLREFCRHKALFCRLRVDRSSNAWASLFSSWLEQTQCDGITDPRRLPLHVFRGHRSWGKRMLTPRGRQDFVTAHRSSAGLNDPQGFCWEDKGPFHGQESVVVAGHRLPDGYHWDAQSNGRELELWTPTAGWTVRAYANIYPDAKVRAREPHARLIKLR